MQQELCEDEHEGVRYDLVERVLDEGAQPAPEHPLHVRHDEEGDEDRPDEHDHGHSDVAESDDGENRHLGQDNRAEDQKIVHNVDASEERGPLHRQVNLGQPLLDFLDGRDPSIRRAR